MNVAIIAAAGQGRRIGGNRAKQFLEIAGTPIIIHTIRKFEECNAIDEIVVVLPQVETSSFLSIAGKYGLRKLSRVVPGGDTRVESVWRGLQSLRPATTEIVAVHDGVRPFVTPSEISLTVQSAMKTGAAILVSPAIDTIKEVSDGKVVRTFDRTQLRHALTPQCFHYRVLRRALEGVQSLRATITDESFLVESLGVQVSIVEGSSNNIKITRPEDLALAEILFREMSAAAT